MIQLVVLLATVILAPIGATIIQLSISRKREFVADASAAELTRYPQALASALNRIGDDTTAPNRDERTIAHMMIAPQLTVRGNASKLFSTHPPMEERVAALMEMASGVPHQHGLPVAQSFREVGPGPQVAESQIEQPAPEQPEQPRFVREGQEHGSVAPPSFRKPD